MSKFVEGSLTLKDESTLTSALEEIFGKGSVEIHEGQGTNLRGYTGDIRPEKANIIIRKKYVNRVSGGASNDLGFTKEKDGTIKMIVSNYDRGHKIHEKIQRRYSELVVDRTLKKMRLKNRMRVLSKSVDKSGSLVIKLGRRTAI
tara:strand:- start:542 stop:976 length:435 start_codon:yes stop_codon:yes gene_type:complete